MFTLKYATMDGQDGELNEETEKVVLSGSDVREVVREANERLKRRDGGIHAVPFMPELFDAEGKSVAATVAQPPYAHELTWILGSAVGSSELWVRADR